MPNKKKRSMIKGYVINSRYINNPREIFVHLKFINLFISTDYAAMNELKANMKPQKIFNYS